MSAIDTLGGKDERIGKYRLIGVLAEGGMARLYLAEQSGPRGFKKVVALKRVLPHLAGHPEFRTMFLHEAIVAARLDHPNIVTTYELGEVDGQYFISMEYLPGEDLAAVLDPYGRASRVPIEIAAAIVQQCAHALSYAHEFVASDGAPICIVHRDVNPSNIVITYHGEVKLLDFGIAKVRNSPAQTRAGSFKGKLSYAAPEQLSGEQLDGRTDIFCLGIVLWECLTGQRLFDGPSEATRLEAVRSRTIVPPSSLRASVPPELDAITMKALARDREQRFQSALAMSEALDRVLAPHRDRVTTRAIGTWLESVFGAERAAVKRATAQGHDLEGSLASLHRMKRARRMSQEPITEEAELGQSLRPTWSTDLAAPPSLGEGGYVEMFFAAEPGPSGGQTEDTYPDHISEVRPLARDPSEPGARPGRRVLLIAPALALAGLLGFVAISSSEGDLPHAERVATGQIEVTSDPPGAQIMIDGEPTGLVTPATLRDLELHRKLEVRVALPGHAAPPMTLELTSKAPVKHSFQLKPVSGEVRLTGLPGGNIKVYVDGQRVDPTQPIELRVGTHEFRVEAGHDLILQRTYDITAGSQTVDLARGE